jgi:hypothetical protein
VLFDTVYGEVSRKLREIGSEIGHQREVSLVPASIKDFRKETLPLYTAVKQEGKIWWGEVDLTLSPEEPSVKYGEAFQKSKAFEGCKIEWTEDLLKEYPSYGNLDLCYSATNHAIQMALAMKGLGYSSKIHILLPLAANTSGRRSLTPSCNFSICGPNQSTKWNLFPPTKSV